MSGASGKYSHDPETNADLQAIADAAHAPSEPHVLDGQFEPAAEAWAKLQPNLPAAEIAQVSIAITLKRLADAMTTPCNAWGETAVEAIGGNIGRALSEDRQWRR